ncbi:cytochrome B [Acuticoccus sediminis]|uniref:Cytochrome B n=1 Tax=Acuticoccus sediminis TaxID=2184697 RepID=A0A8B2NLR8_9HYPH|nr:cytochrome b [Acuticoccus sediminis]RAH99480.1 cytochrome B [Acuticoccus sediminis]
MSAETIAERRPFVFDSPDGFGIVSRALHWGMAALFAWQFTSAALRALAPDSAARTFFWAYHVDIGATIFVLAIARGLWGLLNAPHRPAEGDSTFERIAAQFGQLALHALMIVVPLLAILRSIGNDRAFTVWGVELVAAGGEKNAALVAAGNAAHGLLGWALALLIAGHIVMALFHHLVRRDATLARMLGGPR